jgi:hypothetical protein
MLLCERGKGLLGRVLTSRGINLKAHGKRQCRYTKPVLTGVMLKARQLVIDCPPRVFKPRRTPVVAREARQFQKRCVIALPIELVLAPARATLDARLAAGAAAQYDFAFIDADKTGYDAYYERCLQLLRPGGLIAIDNTLWSGKVLDPQDEQTELIAALNDKIAADDRVVAAMLTVRDGITLIRRR